MSPGPKLLTIDCQYVLPRFAASYLLIQGDEAAFIDDNTAHAVPLLLKELSQQGLRPEQVRYVIVTHAHLDHAGGSSALMCACPNAQLLAHPRAARHLIDPKKLVRSAQAVYGEERFREMYGTIESIPAERVRMMEDGEEVPFGSSHLLFFHTRGHANHHFCILDSSSRSIFTGDSFGLCYPDLQTHGLFVFPSTSPTDFDPTEARLSIEKILASGALRAYPTHFGELQDLRGAASQLNAYFDFAEPIFREIESTELGDRSQEELEEIVRPKTRDYLLRRLSSLGWRDFSLPEKMLGMDIELNASGLVFAAKKRRSKAPKS